MGTKQRKICGTSSPSYIRNGLLASLYCSGLSVRLLVYCHCWWFRKKPFLRKQHSVNSIRYDRWNNQFGTFYMTIKQKKEPQLAPWLPDITWLGDRENKPTNLNPLISLILRRSNLELRDKWISKLYQCQRHESPSERLGQRGRRGRCRWNSTKISKLSPEFLLTCYLPSIFLLQSVGVTIISNATSSSLPL